MISWVSLCSVEDGDGAKRKKYRQCVAVWAELEADASALLDLYYYITPYQLRSIDVLMPAELFSQEYDFFDDASDLVPRVDDKNPIEFGPARPIDASTDPGSAKLTLHDMLLTLGRHPAEICAVLDGAQFDHLPNALTDGQFIYRSLYLDNGHLNPDQLVTAPYMVFLNEQSVRPDGRTYAETVSALLALVDDKPAAVFWQCSEGAEAIYAHLRRTNKVLVPQSAVNGAGDAVTGFDGHTMVVFRHADANVLAQMASAVNTAEASRIFGPCDAVLFSPDAEWSDGTDWYHFVPGQNWPDPGHGPLRLSNLTMDRLAGLRTERLVQKTAKYLRKVLPPNFQDMPQKKLSAAARNARKSGETLGLRSLGAHNRWAYLDVITEGKISQSDKVKMFIQRGADTPDAQVKVAMEETLATMKRAVQELAE